MARALLPLLASLNDKINKLISVQENLLSRIEQLEEENEGLKAELNDKMKQLAKANTDIEFLTISHKLADSPDSIIATRRRIARLIKTIDNCISMINED